MSDQLRLLSPQNTQHKSVAEVLTEMVVVIIVARGGYKLVAPLLQYLGPCPLQPERKRDIGGRHCLIGYRISLFLVLLLVEQVLAHASAWALTEYKRVVLLADNMLVVENIDDLFQCPGICAGKLLGRRVVHSAFGQYSFRPFRPSLFPTVLLFFRMTKTLLNCRQQGGRQMALLSVRFHVCILRWIPMTKSNEEAWSHVVTPPPAAPNLEAVFFPIRHHVETRSCE